MQKRVRAIVAHAQHGPDTMVLAEQPAYGSKTIVEAALKHAPGTGS